MQRKFFTIIILSLFLLQNQALAQVSSVHTGASSKNYFELNDGESVDGILKIKNNGEEKMDVHLYAADGDKTDLGAISLKVENSISKTVGSWIIISQKDHSLEPKEIKDVPYTIKIPKGTVPGNYAGGIAIENSNTDGSNGGMVVKITNRVVEPFLVSIKGTQTIKYSWKEINYDNTSEPQFNVVLKNEGNTIINVEGQIDISGYPFEPQTKKIDVNMVTLLPGEESELKIKWNEKPNFGLYKAVTKLSFYNNNYSTGEKILLNTESKETNFKIIPWPIIITILIAILAAIGFIMYKKMAYKKEIKKAKKYTIQKGDTLLGIAEKNKTSWKHLAKINKISEPYELIENSTIIIPQK